MKPVLIFSLFFSGCGFVVGLEKKDLPATDAHVEDGEGVDGDMTGEDEGEEPGDDLTLGGLEGTDTSDWDGIGNTTLQPAADSYISEFEINSNYGDADRLYVAQDASTSGYRRTLIRFDLSTIPASAQVESSELSLLLLWIDDTRSTEEIIAVHRVQQSPSRDWQELQVNWERYADGLEWSTPGGDFSSEETDSQAVSMPANDRKSWNVIHDVQDFVDSPSSNYGWILKQQGDTPSFSFNFGSRECAEGQRPELEVSYVARAYDIDGGNNEEAFLAGDTAEALGLAMKLSVLSGSNGFTTSSIVSGDRYEVSFSIGMKAFIILFVGTGSSEGNLYLFHNVEGLWTLADNFNQESIVSERIYSSESGDMGFKLTDSTSTRNGEVMFEIKKSFFQSLSAFGSGLTEISAATYFGSSTSPSYADREKGVNLDRCPQGTSTASYMLNVPII